MLASLLPGVRELRAPLASGYIWVVTVWLAVGPLVPRPAATSSGLLRDVYDLGAALGRPAVIGAVSLAAYLVGVLSVAVSSRLLFASARRPWREGMPHRPSSAGRDMLREAVLDRLVARYGERTAEADVLTSEAERVLGYAPDVRDPAVARELLRQRIDIDAHVEAVSDDLALLPRRLLGDPNERDLYTEYDRQRAEAEFRAATALPLFFLMGVLIARASPLWAVGFLAPLVLMADARQNDRAAGDILAEAVRARQPQSPALRRVETGKLIPRDDDSFLRAAAGDGNHAAQYRLACKLSESGDAGGAAHYLESAATGGYPAALYDSAKLAEEHGELETARARYEKAARAEYAPAMRALGALAELGKSPSEAVDWYSKAADAEDAESIFRLGELKESAHDDDAAQLFYFQAAQRRHPRAMRKWAEVLAARGKAAEAEDWRRQADVAEGEGRRRQAEPADRSS